jgi:hypothetical protein
MAQIWSKAAQSEITLRNVLNKGRKGIEELA